MELVSKTRLSSTALAFCLCLLAAAPAQAQAFSDPRVADMFRVSAPAPGTAREQQAAAEAAQTPACVPQPFGQSLFDGDAAKTPGAMMSPQQRVAPGDRVNIAIWGAVETEEVSTVDSQGFIYIKGVGPVQVAGKTEESLSRDIRAQIGRVFKDDVQVYARLEQGAGTPVLVTGNVRRPGQYHGSAQDSLVVWLQRAGGILPQQGSYRNIGILHDGKRVAEADLYAFLQEGATAPRAWTPGDVIVVGSPWAQVSAEGSVRRCAAFELPPGQATGGGLIALAQPAPGTSHAVLKGFRNSAPMTRVLSLEGLSGMPLQDGDRVSFYAAPVDAQITVSVEGNTQGNSLLAVPRHAPLSSVLAQIPVDPVVSNASSIYLRRASVAAMQRKALDEALNRLLQSALTAPAGSDGEAVIRAKEAELIERFAAVVKTITPEGRIVVMRNGTLNDLPLEEGDVIVIPQKTNVVTVEGEVVLPRAVVEEKGAAVKDYVKMAGGYTERALKSDYIVIHPNGDATRDSNPEIAAGDRLLVLPRVDTKGMQTAKDLVQILYQVAVGAGVLLKL